MGINGKAEMCWKEVPRGEAIFYGAKNETSYRKTYSAPICSSIMIGRNVSTGYVLVDA